MKKKSSGRHSLTSRSRKTDAFKIEFNLLENKIISAGPKSIHIQILDQNKNAIAPKGITSLKDGGKIQYSDSVEVNYKNNRLSLVSLVLVNRDDINEGKYTISTFIDGIFTGNTILKLR